MKAFLTVLALGLIALMPAAFAENSAEMAQKDVNLVVFYSDTCGSCKILEPKMMDAMGAINMDRVNMVKLDFSNKDTIAASQSLASAQNVDSTLQKYGAKTGFAVIVDHQGNELAKITKDDSPAEIANKLTSSVLAPKA